jgi:protein-tyrosine phosphatase
MARLLRGNGAEVETFAAHRLTANLVREADLVLTLTRLHRSTVVDLWPAAVRRTFTLRELARLLQQIDVPALRTGLRQSGSGLRCS